ncbi:MAG: hypothetical protein Q9184_005581 [Pyrenodesmia sp. 2 TL-2023]
MGDLLVPVRTRTVRSEDERVDRHRQSAGVVMEVQSPEQALEALRSRPQRQLLLRVLRWISGNLNIGSHTPLTSQIIHALVNDILPDHWGDLKDDGSGNGRKIKDLIVRLLSNVGGISAIATRMRLLTNAKVELEPKGQIPASGRAALLADLLSSLEFVLGQDGFLSSIWSNLNASVSEPSRRRLLWKELVTLLGSGRVLSIASEADLCVAEGSSTIRERSWISHGSEYSSWLGRNLGRFMEGSQGTDAHHKKAWAQMLERATSLGHTDQIVGATYNRMIFGDNGLKTALSNSLRAFGDKISIQHTPIIKQEGTTENLLLLAGYVHRKEPQHIAHMARSSIYLNAISNRLAAPSPRLSVLGMYVGTAISELVDPPDKRMNFSSEELNNAEGQRYINLKGIRDPIGSIEDLNHKKALDKQMVVRNAKSSAAQQVQQTPSNSQHSKGSRIISIEEVESESGSEEDDDLPMYAKPDSDASDSDDDPTVINRDKPTAPVYINDLITGLRDTENYDRHNLALTHASSLIRRKASFGTEVTDNTQELASILTGIQDKWDISNFEELRLQGMIAVLVAQPLEMGQWFSATYFNGDYSISQRAAVLTTLGLGARELAGYGKEDAALTKSNQDTSFPSKKLPSKLHALYASPEVEPIALASTQLEQSILRPMALNAADALSGPNALKIRTFSSRMEVEKKRTRPITNALAKVVADGFFFPLTGRFSMHTQGFPLLSPPLLPLYLRTLSLLLHASGRSTLLLPQLTHEFLLLLLSLRPHTATALPTLQAFLSAFLTILEVNSDREGQRRLASENAKEVLELNALVEGVFERVSGEGEEEGKVRMLAAGCVGRWREVVEREEGRLMGWLVTARKGGYNGTEKNIEFNVIDTPTSSSLTSDETAIETSHLCK